MKTELFIPILIFILFPAVSSCTNSVTGISDEDELADSAPAWCMGYLSILKYLSPEESVQEASLIAEVIVNDIQYVKEENTSGFGIIQLQVIDHVIGASPDVIELKNSFVLSGLGFFWTDVSPAYKTGERFITTLREDPMSDTYYAVGFYNGKFPVVGKRMKNTRISVDTFKELIKMVKSGQIDTFPDELPRFGREYDCQG